MNFFKRLFSKPEEGLDSRRLEAEAQQFLVYLKSIFDWDLLRGPVKLYSDTAAINVFTGYLYGALCTLNKSQGSENLLLVELAFTNLMVSNFETATDREQFFELERRSIEQRQIGIDSLHEGYCSMKIMDCPLFVSALRAGVEDYQSLLTTTPWKATNLVRVLKENNLCSSRLEEMILSD